MQVVRFADGTLQYGPLADGAVRVVYPPGSPARQQWHWREDGGGVTTSTEYRNGVQVTEYANNDILKEYPDIAWAPPCFHFYEHASGEWETFYDDELYLVHDTHGNVRALFPDGRREYLLSSGRAFQVPSGGGQPVEVYPEELAEEVRAPYPGHVGLAQLMYRGHWPRVELVRLAFAQLGGTFNALRYRDVVADLAALRDAARQAAGEPGQ